MPRVSASNSILDLKAESLVPEILHIPIHCLHMLCPRVSIKPKLHFHSHPNIQSLLICQVDRCHDNAKFAIQGGGHTVWTGAANLQAGIKSHKG